MRATVAIKPMPAIGPLAREVVIDCEHGRTSLAMLPPTETAPRLVDAQLVGIALLRHFAEERCRCTRHLRRRYLGAA
jgi:hypothetical protein